MATALGPANMAGGRLLDETADVACLQLTLVNVFLVGPPGAPDRGWVLVDTGQAPSAGRIARAAAERFGPRSRPAAILLTHGHFDHVGSAKALAERWDAPVYAHPLEAPYLTGQSDYPPPDPTVGGGLLALASPLFSRKPVDLGACLRILPAGGAVPPLPGWRWLPTPGHSPGHVSFFRDADRTLIAGDAFVTVRQESLLSVMAQRAQVHRPPAYFTPDWSAARRSVALLADLDPEAAGTGHGPPMHGEELRRGLRSLAQNFDRAVPAEGRYVHSPARADGRGVVWVPPPEPPPLAYVVAGMSAAFAAGAAAGRVGGELSRHRG